MKTLKSILKYIFLLFANLLKILKEMFLSKTKVTTKKETKNKVENKLKEEKKVIPNASTPPKDDGIKTIPNTSINTEDELINITNEINYNIIAREYINYVLEKKYEINKYDRNEEVIKEVEKIKDILSPSIEQLFINNPNNDHYKTTINMIEKEVKDNEKLKELKKIVFPIIIKNDTFEEINKKVEEIINNELDLENSEDQEFIEEEMIEHVTEFSKVITTNKVEDSLIKENQVNKTISKQENKEDIKPKDKSKQKNEKKQKKEEKHDDTIYLDLINRIDNSINYYKTLLSTEQTKSGLEYKNYENITSNITKDIKRYEYLLIACKHKLSPIQINNISSKIDQLENTKNDISESLEVDVKIEENNLSTPINDNERNTIQKELDNVKTNTFKYNLNSLEELNYLDPNKMKSIEKKLITDKLREMLNLKPSIIYKLPFMKKNHFLNFSSSLLINANIKQLFNIIQHQTNNNYNYNLHNVDNNQDALNNNQSLIDDNIDELNLFKSSILNTHPHLATDPEINLYFSALKNDLSSRQTRVTNKQKMIKKYCHNKVRKRILTK